MPGKGAEIRIGASLFGQCFDSLGLDGNRKTKNKNRPKLSFCEIHLMRYSDTFSSIQSSCAEPIQTVMTKTIRPSLLTKTSHAHQQNACSNRQMHAVACHARSSFRIETRHDGCSHLPRGSFTYRPTQAGKLVGWGKWSHGAPVNEFC